MCGFSIILLPLRKIKYLSPRELALRRGAGEDGDKHLKYC